jgi:hypothetical protein
MGLKPKTILSIDIDSDATVVTELSLRHNKVVLTSQHVVPSAENLSALNVNKNQVTVTSLPVPSLFLKHIQSTPALSRARDVRRDILPALQKLNLPLKLDECFWQVVPSGPVITLVAARREIVEETRTRLSSAGFSVSGVVPAAYGLYNLILHNYGEKGKFLLLNMRGRVSDIMFHEDRRLWTYPLPIGRSSLTDNAQSSDAFLQEVKRVVNTHYLQNPSKSSKSSMRVYLSGANYPASIVSALREHFPGCEIIQVNPLRKISCPKAVLPSDPYSIGSSIGYGLTCLRASSTVYVNLIGEQVRTERIASRINYAEKLAVYSLAAACAGLVFVNVRSVFRLQDARSRAARTCAQAAAYIPEIKNLKEKKARLDAATQFLQSKIDNQELFLKAMAAVSAGASTGIEIKEFELKEGEKGLELYISGTSADYNEINQFIVKLRGTESVSDVKVVSSGSGGNGGAGAAQDEQAAIEFKIRFDMRRRQGIST